jgi:Bacterial SH3 domain
MFSKNMLLVYVIFLLFLNSCVSSTAVPSATISPSSTAIIPTDTPTYTPIPPTPMTGCAKTTVRVRSEPNTSSEILGRLTTGTCVSVVQINTENTWVWISSPEISGWVSTDFLSVSGDKSFLPVADNNSNNTRPALTPTADTPSSLALLPTSTIASRNTNTPFPIATQSSLLCGNTGSHIGEFVSCKIPRAYCSYQPGVSGSPTFCNDAPYPNNNFTLVVWGSDYSNYNGKCIIVSGLVTRYNGKPQIAAQNQPQVSYCP